MFYKCSLVKFNFSQIFKYSDCTLRELKTESLLNYGSCRIASSFLFFLSITLIQLVTLSSLSSLHLISCLKCNSNELELSVLSKQGFIARKFFQNLRKMKFYFILKLSLKKSEPRSILKLCLIFGRYYFAGLLSLF